MHFIEKMLVTALVAITAIVVISFIGSAVKAQELDAPAVAANWTCSNANGPIAVHAAIMARLTDDQILHVAEVENDCTVYPFPLRMEPVEHIFSSPSGDLHVWEFEFDGQPGFFTIVTKELHSALAIWAGMPVPENMSAPL